MGILDSTGYLVSEVNITTAGNILNLEYFSANITSITCGSNKITTVLPSNLFSIAQVNWFSPFDLVTSTPAFCGNADGSYRTFYRQIIHSVKI
jgi:hypothetical protein